MTLLPEHLYTCEQTRILDKSAIETHGISGIVLMKRAGKAAFRLLNQTWPDASRIIVLCGGGNNGGDGYVVAALAAQRKLNVEVFALKPPQSLAGEALKAYEYARQENVLVKDIVELNCAGVGSETVIVDALLGTGFKGELRRGARTVIEKVNASSARVMSLDIPSGLEGDTGHVPDVAIKADSTITFIGVKQGLLTGKGRTYCGELVFDSLDVPAVVYDAVASSARRVSRFPHMPPRERDSHKSDFGHIVVVGGDHGMGGAVMLAAESCLRAGGGMVSVVTRPEHVSASLARIPEVMARGVAAGPDLDNTFLEKADVIIVGPGLGRSTWSRQMLHAVLQTDGPKVIDADALNLIADHGLPECDRSEWIITPHPGEAARLLGVSTADIQRDRFTAANRLTKEIAGIVVLKGSGTLIADDSQLALANVGNPGMAIPGSGDVLTGVIAALIGQGMKPFAAAVAAVCAHGNAGDQLALQGERGICASDLIPEIRQQVNG